MRLFEMKRFLRLLAFLMFGMLFVAAQTSCLHGTVYGLSDSIDDGGNQGSSGGSSSEGSGNSDIYQQNFEKEFGNINPSQNWNMSKSGMITVTTPTSSTIYIYGTDKSGKYGSKLLAVFSGISGTQALPFDWPSGLGSVYMVISNSLFTQGKTVPNGGSISFSNTDGIDLTSSVTPSKKIVTADPTIFQVLPDGTNNQGNTTQSSKFISDGAVISVTPVYSNCSFNNTIGVYVQGSTLQEYDLWTKTQNFTSGEMEMPTFNLTLPAGAIFGFYIKNSLGTFYTDATLNQSNAKAASTLTVNDKTYVAFEDMPLSGDMDFNDMVIRVTPVLTILDNDPNEWIIATETDKNPDYDFNDVVLKVTSTKDDGKLQLVMLNVGTQEELDLYLGNTLIGEVHNLAANTLSYVSINVPNDFSLSENMGGFNLKAGDRIISPSNSGDAPRFLLIKDGNWKWPAEGVNISKVYPSFKDWVSKPDTKWYSISETEIEDKSSPDKDVEQGGTNTDVEDGPVNSYGGDGPNKASLSFADKAFNTSYVDWYWAAPTDYPYDENHQYVDSQGGIHQYDGHDYHILFSSYDTPKMLDAVYFNEGTFVRPEEISTIGIAFEAKKAEELPLGTYEGKKFNINIWNNRQVGTSYYFGYTPNLSEFDLYSTAKMTISKDGNDYVITITDLTLKGGPIDSDGNEIDSKYYTNISFTYKGPLPKLADKYNDVVYY
jgi:hypothetical protein